VRGREDRLAAFEPWPADLGPELRARYLAAFGLIAAQPARAAERFDELAREHPADPVPAALARCLRAELGGVRESPT
jgi:adenylate cyclase